MWISIANKNVQKFQNTKPVELLHQLRYNRFKDLESKLSHQMQSFDKLFKIKRSFSPILAKINYDQDAVVNYYNQNKLHFNNELLNFKYG